MSVRRARIINITTINQQSFERDPYLTTLDTVAVEAGSDGRAFVVTADTLLYPEGGGQPADRGTLTPIPREGYAGQPDAPPVGVEVLDVRRVGDQIRHYVAAAMAPGPVRIQIDWQRRWDHMQQHTAQHLVTAIALNRFGWPTTAFNLGENVSSIELDVPRLSATDLTQLEDAAAQEIRAAHPVTIQLAEIGQLQALGVRSRRLPSGFKGPVRLIEIAGIDLNTCGGTHVRSTAELATICLLGTEPMRGGTRVFYVAGDRVRRRLAGHEARNAALRLALSSREDDFVEVIESQLRKAKQLARSKRKLAEELASAWVEVLAAREEKFVSAHWTAQDMSFLRKLGLQLAATAPDKIALLTAGEPPEVEFVVAAGPTSGCDLAATGKRVCDLLAGRGGGRPPIFAGKAKRLAPPDELWVRPAEPTG